MENIDGLKEVINNYINKCKLIFDKKRSDFPKLIPLKKDIKIDTKSIFTQAIRESEDSDEFAALIGLSKNFPLFKRDHVKATKIACDSFFKNTGIYYSLWIEKEININSLVDIFYESTMKKKFNRINLFVFDGFALYDTNKNRNMLKDITLPFGKLQVIQKDEIDELFKIPQCEHHYHFDSEKIYNLVNCYCLKISDEENYRKPEGLIAGNDFFTIDFFELKKREADIERIGPLFLCLGEDANLAEEIIIRTCIFDSQPISISVRNDYLPPEPSVHNDGVDFSPRRYVKYVGQNGIMLTNIYKMWNEVNQLDKNGYLHFSTETYVRSIMNLHARQDSSMENFVSFITVMDSLLTRDGRGDLAYKIASRGAAILSPDSKERAFLMSKLKESYKIRSTIVHEGHSKKKNLDNLLAVLPDIIRHIFIKFITIVYLFRNSLLDGEIMKHISEPKNINKSIADILDFAVMEPEMVNIIERKLSEMHIDLGHLSIRALV